MCALRLFSRPNSGFTLLEMTISVAIISIVAVMGLEMAAAFVSSTAYQTTTDRSNAIDAALVKYRTVYGRLPCPTALNKAQSDTGFGKEDCATSIAVPGNAFNGTIAKVTGGVATITVSNGGTGYVDNPVGSGTFPVVLTDTTTNSATGAAATAWINSGIIQYITVDNPGYGYKEGDVININLSAGAPGVNAVATASVSGILIGALPVRDLDLPLGDAFDGFANKYFYYVPVALTATTTSNPTVNFSNASGVIQVRSGPLLEPCVGNCSVTQANAAYGIVSPGKDQRGGYNKHGAMVKDCVPVALTYGKAIDALNCFFEGSANTVALTPAQPLGIIYNSPFNNGSNYPNYTDDIVVTRMKSDL